MTAIAELSSPNDLQGLVGNRRWVLRNRPFRHVVARDVFTPDFYADLHRQSEAVLGEGKNFSRNMGAYDASSSPLEQHRGGALGVFLSRAWHDLIAGIWDVDATGDVTATLHHHEPGGRSGWPHNDLNPAWFGGTAAAADEVRISDNDVVDYQTGKREAGVEARECARAVAILFYLGNPDWQPGDGGETGLYASMSGAARGPYAAVPPINNSLVMFECTPFTWHSFMTNRLPRTSVVMWLHRPRAQAIARWGEQSLVHW